MSLPLYTTEILRLAASTARFERLKNAQGSADRRSPTCGSRIVVDITLDETGAVAAIGQEVRACALGQASAALMADGVIGKSIRQLEDARDALRNWLSGQADQPGPWPGLSIFAPAIPKHARHPAIMLAFEAAAEAAHRAAGD
jgi:NifU-like protein involved in Fe-S cluster formation